MTGQDPRDAPPTTTPGAEPWPTRWKLGCVVLGLCVLLGLMEAGQIYVGAAVEHAPISWQRAIGSVMPSWIILAALTPGILFLSRRFPLERSAWRVAALVHLVAATTFGVLHLGATAMPHAIIRADTARFWVALSHLLRVYFVLDLLTYWAIVAADHAFRYYREIRARELAASQLQASLTEARLGSLRAQLNPHFLFNTLNAISVLALKKRHTDVVAMLERLSDLLRRSLDDSPVQEVPLVREIELVDAYLDIQRIRFGDRLTIDKRIAPDTLDSLVPSMILQPIIENAVEHGVAESLDAGRIEISAVREGGVVRLQVRDSGPGFEPGRELLRHKGIGLSNTRARLEQLYGPAQRLDLDTDERGGAAVTISLPCRPLGTMREEQHGGAPT